MKTFLTICIIIGITNIIFSQPLNGSYTVGGNTPDFVTLQEAADTLKVNGVSGPVFFNIRPGTYMKNNGNNTVLILDGIVAGLSESNRVTFQPDDAAGGDVDNVILLMSINDRNTANSDLVRVSLDYITFHNLTFQEADTSLHIGFSKLVNQLVSSFNVPVIGTVFDGCKFTGSASIGTDNGIELAQAVRNITFRGNIFLRLLRGISGANTWFLQETITIEDNQFLAGWSSFSGSGNALGSAMEVHGENMIVRRNIVDFAGSFNSGYRGVYLFTNSATETIIVEQNSIKGQVSAALYIQSQGGSPDSFVVANNMINVVAFPVWANEAAYGLRISVPNAKILFNTIVAGGGFSLYGLSIDSENSTVMNNIIIIKPSAGFSTCYSQGASTNINFQSDYNVLFTTDNSAPLVSYLSLPFYDLASYQLATGLDTNSASKYLDFVGFTDLHITDCQSQDPDLDGIPVAGITVDIDNDIRSTTTPMIGADENSFAGFNMFGDPFSARIPGVSFDIAADNFDNLLFDGIAVPDYFNRQVLLYHNIPPRSFELDNILQTVFNPVAVKFYDLDDDSFLDLIVGGDTNAVQVFWGDGIGGFSSPVTVGTFGRVRSLEPGPTFAGNIQRTMMITQDNGFLPNTSTLGYLFHLGNRVLCHDFQRTGNFGETFDTVFAVMHDFVVGEFADDGDFPEIAAVTTFPLPHPLILINNFSFTVGTSFPCADIVAWGNITEHSLGVGSTAGQSNIIKGDFDGDGDLDLITLQSLDSVLFIKNLGNLNFSPEKISATSALAVAAMDYENDGDLDFITINERIEEHGITVFLNDGTGSFTTRENCFFPFARGLPRSVVASDFDLDGKTDLAIVSSVDTGVDSLFVIYNLGGGTVGIEGEEELEIIPTEYSISQNYPNPFNPTTKIEYALPFESNVKISVFNIIGEKVREIINNQMSVGIHTASFNADNLASGIYIYRIEARTLSGAESFIAAKKMILLK